MSVSGAEQGISGQPFPKALVVMLPAWDPARRKEMGEGERRVEWDVVVWVLSTGDPHLYLALWRLRQEEHHKLQARLGRTEVYFL